MIKSISYDQQEILQNIIELYCPLGIDCDPTYSKGIIYKGLTIQPLYRFDINPQGCDVEKADCRKLPLKNESIRSLFFDPPFVGGSVNRAGPGIIKGRFGFYKNLPILWKMYRDSLKEFYRVLAQDGVLIFKCQDVVESSKQYLSEFKIIKEALGVGFYPKDKFILIAKHRLPRTGAKRQYHARKYHCYFLVFLKCKSKVDYGV